MNIIYHKSRTRPGLKFSGHRHIFLCAVICLFTTTWSLGHAQYFYTFITNTSAFDATGFNNSHKIAIHNEDPGADTICVVYQNEDSVMYVQSVTRGTTWQTPIALAQGKHPGIDIDVYGFRHVVWEQIDTITNKTDIMYDCLDDYGPPVNISESPENSILADLVVDDTLCAHIVWVEDTAGRNQIMYRPCHSGSPGTMMLINPPPGHHTLPSISIHAPSNRVYVIWDRSNPNEILLRYKQGFSWSITEAVYHSLTGQTGHSSIDYDHGHDSVSFCYDYETSTSNMEVAFKRGNGGGYPTNEESTCPVMTTIGDVWSYLFWQEDSAGYEDILFHLYYFVHGWYDQGSIRTEFSINEPVRFPNCCGAYLVWTQGTSPPYKLYFADFGYPVDVDDNCQVNSSGICLVSPNPFKSSTTIKFQIPNPKSQDTRTRPQANLYDVSGRVIRTFSLPGAVGSQFAVCWDGSDHAGNAVPAGAYFLVIDKPGRHLVQKIIKLK
jgi:hypothetical protein